MSHSKIYFQFLIFYFIFISAEGFSLDSFSKSIYASINEAQDIKSLNHKSIINTEYLILKYEQPFDNFEGSHNNQMSLYVNSKFYHNLISLDTNDKKNFYTMKNNILKHVSTFHYKVSDSYTIIEDKNHFILERLEYIDEKLDLEEKNIFLNKNYWYNLINDKPMNTSPEPLIEKLTNINIYEVNKSIIKDFNKISKWNKDNSYELFFVYDKKKDKFILHKIFIYFIKGENKLININLKPFKFENSIFEHKNNIYKNFYFKNKFSNEGYTDNNEYKIKITTNKKDSIYHNMMSLTFDEKTLNRYYNASGKNDICFLIHYVLTEDVYIERNEFIKRFEETLYSYGIDKSMMKEIKYNLFASKFIEQELSSDLSEQAYFDFLLCANKNIIDILNKTISFTVHFRYQPSLKANSTKSHQITVMPQPFVFIFGGNYTYDNFLDELIYKNNVFSENDKKKDKMAIFEDEVKIKKLKIINQIKVFNDNYKELIHEIPGGQMKYFWNITFVTIITCGIGFLIIFSGVLKYISADRPVRIKKIE